VRFGEIRSIHTSYKLKRKLYGVVLDNSGRFCRLFPDQLEVLDD
jgi:hypothetical protein